MDPAAAASADDAPATPIRALAWSGMTHKGRFRKNNEDAFLALNLDATEVRYLGKEGEGRFDSGDYVFAVSDGMGGANAGEFASRIAVEKITALLPRAFRLKAQGFQQDAADILTELVTGIHAAMIEMGRHYEECAGMGATLSLGWITPTRMHFAHVGDSRIYYLPVEGPMRQITHDHTHAGWLLRQGKINEREARNHPTRNQLEMSLGSSRRSVEPQIGAVKLLPGDRFVFCTDGIIDGVWNHNLEDIVRGRNARLNAFPPARRLVEEANSESGRDNLTAVVVELH